MARYNREVATTKLVVVVQNVLLEVLKKHTSLKYLRMGHNHINDGVTCIAQALGKEC